MDELLDMRRTVWWIRSCLVALGQQLAGLSIVEAFMGVRAAGMRGLVPDLYDFYRDLLVSRGVVASHLEPPPADLVRPEQMEDHIRDLVAQGLAIDMRGAS